MYHVRESLYAMGRRIDECGEDATPLPRFSSQVSSYGLACVGGRLCAGVRGWEAVAVCVGGRLYWRVWVG